MVFQSKQPLKFSKFLKSRWLTGVKDHVIKKPNIVVNISNKDTIISGPEPRKVLPPRKSTILQGNNSDMLHKLNMIVSRNIQQSTSVAWVNLCWKWSRMQMKFSL